MFYLYCISALICVLALGSSTQVNSIKKNRTTITYSNLYFVLIFLVLLFLTMFRGNTIGNDTQTYINSFNRFISYGGINSGERMEIGFQWFCLLVGKISKDPHAFIALSGLATYLIVGSFFYKKCYQPVYAISIFFCTSFSQYTNVIRMAFAISILLWSFEKLRNKQLVQGVLLLVLAILFHKSYLLVIPVAVLIYFDIKFTPKLFAITALGVLALSIGSSFFLGILETATSMMGGRFGGYLSTARTETGVLGTLFSMIKLAVMFLIYKKTVNKKKIPEYIKWYFAFALLFLILNFVMNLFDRIASAFVLMLIVPVINEILESESEKKKRNIMFLIIFFLASFLFTVYMRPEWNHLYPYEFWF